MNALRLCLLASAAAIFAVPASAAPFLFSTGNPDGRIGTLSQPGTVGAVETESADDFILSAPTQITGATFTGLITGTTPTIGAIVTEIYRVFPNDSDTLRTPNVNTRTNSPSDNAFDSRSNTSGLTFTTSSAGAFAVGESITTGIHPKPNQFTGGDGAASGNEVTFTINFTTPLDLPADHYFFVPQVEVTGGDFLWLSTAKPIISPGTPFIGDLQSWIRNADLDPDWSRIGTDVINASSTLPVFNAAFTLTGNVPEPASLLVLTAGLAGLAFLRRRPG